MKYIPVVCFCLGLLLALPGFSTETRAADADGQRLVLPKPETTGGKPLMEALALRQSNRKISDAPITEQELSNLLWATFGINRPDGRRTAPTANNRQNIHVYVAMENGVWLYEAKEHALERVLAQDVRSKLGGAPVTLLYAAPDSPYSGLHAGSLYQNAGLYCASAGLANVVKATGAKALMGTLPLPSGWSILIIQSVGMPG